MGGWHGLAQCFMRALLIELAAKMIEALLLCERVSGWRFGGLSLERLVHSFMPSVLLGLGRCDALGCDAELEPPHRQAAQPRHPHRSERCAIVGTYHARQAKFTEQPLEMAAAAAMVGGCDDAA